MWGDQEPGKVWAPLEPKGRMRSLAEDGREGPSKVESLQNKGWKQIGYSVGMCLIHMVQSFWEEKLESGGLPQGNRRAWHHQFAKGKLVYVT